MKTLFSILLICANSIGLGQEKQGKATVVHQFKVISEEFGSVYDDIEKMGKGVVASDAIHLVRLQERAVAAQFYFCLLHAHEMDAMRSPQKVNLDTANKFDRLKIGLAMNNFRVSCRVVSAILNDIEKDLEKDQIAIKNAAIVAEARELLEVCRKSIATLKPNVRAQEEFLQLKDDFDNHRGEFADRVPKFKSRHAEQDGGGQPSTRPELE